MFFQNQIWSRLLDINRLCLVCIKRSIEEVKKCQISKHGYHQGPSDETLKKARCQFWDFKFGHRIMEAVGFFDYKMHSFIQIIFNFTNKWSKDVVWWFTETINTVALKGHHNISFSLHYINFDLREKNIMGVCIHNYLACIHNYLPCTYINILHVYIIISPVSEGSGDVMVLRRSRLPSAARRPPPAARRPPPAIVLTR